MNIPDKSPDSPAPKQLSFVEAEQALLEILGSHPEDRLKTLNHLTSLYAGAGRHEDALLRLRELFTLLEDKELKAGCALSLGGRAEEMNDFTPRVLPPLRNGQNRPTKVLEIIQDGRVLLKQSSRSPTKRVRSKNSSKPENSTCMEQSRSIITVARTSAR